MLKISHIINPVLVNPDSDLFTAQPITFETMRVAKEFSEGKVDVTLFTAQYKEDRVIIPDYLTLTADLTKSVLEFGQFKIPRKLPLLKDILKKLYDSSDADYLIYSNADIALMPSFYLTVSKIINQGYDGFVVNRRTISKNYNDIKQIPLMYAEVGEPHRRYDCFIFKRDTYPKYRLGNVCLGIGGVGRVLVWNVVAHANRFREFKDFHLTFHIGNDSIWRNTHFNDYTHYNQQEAINIIREIKSDSNKIIFLNSNTYFRGYKQIKQVESIINEATDKFIYQHKFIFIAGLHRSGTTILAHCLNENPEISSFSNTGFPKDEGQFLQSVFLPAKEFGGPGKFGFRKEMHLTEKSSLITDENKEKLLSEWCRHWDISKSILLEKSPPNILKLRFLQSMFSSAYFIIITRHPLAVSYATQKWSKTSIDELLTHWIVCHKIMIDDLKCVNNYIMVKYENFVEEPNNILKKIYDFIGINYHEHKGQVQPDTNSKYFEKWINDRNNNKLKEKYKKYASFFSSLGYDFENF